VPRHKGRVVSEGGESPGRKDVVRRGRKAPACAALGALVIFVAATGLLAAGADTRVADAAMSGDRQAVRALIKQKADVNGAQGDGMTALHWAATNDDAELAQILVSAGAKVQATTRLGGVTPLLMAAQTGDARLIDVLLTAGADVNAASSLGVTPMMMAATGGSVDAIKALARRSADVNARENTYGQTPLMFAAANNHAQAITALIELGAKTDLATKIRTPAGRGGGGGGRGGGAGAGRGGRAAAAGVPGDGGRGGRNGGRGNAAPQVAGNATAPATAAASATPATATEATPQPAPAPADDAARPNAEDNGITEPRPATEPGGGLTPLHYAARQGQKEAARAARRRRSHQ